MFINILEVIQSIIDELSKRIMLVTKYFTKSFGCHVNNRQSFFRMKHGNRHETVNNSVNTH